MALTVDQLAQYRRDGFVAVDGVADSAACDALRAHTEALVDAFEPDSVKSIFSSRNQHRHANEYFLASANNISFFFEEDAFDDTGELRKPKAQSINKMGHAMHDLDPHFDKFSRNPKLGQIVEQIGFTEPRLVQSMYIFKPPEIGGEVLCHQDATYLYTEPISVIGLWFALEDATCENGCLWALPMGQKTGLKSRFRRTPDGRLTTQVLDPAPWPTDDLVPIEVPKGTLVVLDGQCPHYSAPNLSSKSREAYTLHIIDAACDYPSDNWLLRDSNFPLRGFV